MTELHVITGPPSCGKSSVIRALQVRGYQTIPESARYYFEQKISEGYEPGAAREQFDYRSDIIEIDRSLESDLDDSRYFLDRSLADNIIYHRFEGSDVPPSLAESCEDRYDSVHLLEPLDLVDDGVRNEDESDQQELYELTEQVYRDLGYSVEHVPVRQIDKRVDMILDSVE